MGLMTNASCAGVRTADTVAAAVNYRANIL